MFTRDEKRAIVFLVGMTAVGALVRAIRAGSDGPPGAAIIAPGLLAGDLAAQESSARRLLAATRPLEAGERVDLDRADAAEIERLSGVGPQLARRIVEERTANGPFGSTAGLSRVRGVGPAIMATVVKEGAFAGVPASPAGDAQDPQGPGLPGQRARKAPRLTARAAGSPAQGTGPAIATMPPPPPPSRIDQITVVPRARSARTPARRRSVTPTIVCPATPISINDASAAELTCLPGIGPTLAQRIVTWRTDHGPFAEVAGLERVPGLGATRIRRLGTLVRVP